jgi:hypothetical protein
MELTPYVDDLRRELAVAAEAGGPDARALAERLVAPLEAAVRLMLLDALSAAADEITGEMAPGSVELRLRSGAPEFVVTPAPAPADADGPDPDLVPSPPPPPPPPDAPDGGTARINLRLPEQLKASAEQAAAREGLSLNAWLIRAVAAAVAGPQRGRDQGPRSGRPGQSFTGWVR